MPYREHWATGAKYVFNGGLDFFQAPRELSRDESYYWIRPSPRPASRDVELYFDCPIVRDQLRKTVALAYGWDVQDSAKFDDATLMVLLDIVRQRTAKDQEGDVWGEL